MVTDRALGSTEHYLLYGVIFDVMMLDRQLANKPVHIEVTMGRLCVVTNSTHLPHPHRRAGDTTVSQSSETDIDDDDATIMHQLTSRQPAALWRRTRTPDYVAQIQYVVHNWLNT
jgi:hypothetical protein